ncbi:hypothetical protein MCOR27_004560 [Pyricularia oryzae]|nr:hypothetical protein MCOR01_007868 [Pyricularia oryzae]KAI6297016.1 hypothetical protein MCOR33_006559 [Pyricularia grisea]KAH9433473.1 hypothetical protein MCOR02_005522 [Pyricularia oryzae]KAI6254784.1 hypothetical protein MCOR19_008709 [Pyricularia oryzae]KAI6273668.1 hypothetical protein MCOR26_006807 [Pyricularia oryzae]
MVQTRSASSTAVPRLSPPPPSPTKRRVSNRSASNTPAPTSPPAAAAEVEVTKPSAALRGGSSSSTTSSSSPAILSHTPSTLALAWLAISLPLVAWDTGYIMLRPHSMPGGSWHAPIWVPYALYGQVDYVYGRERWEAGDGFCGAQGTMNIVETLMYLAYLWIWYSNKTATGASGSGAASTRGAVTGRSAGLAMLIMFSACVMTVSKTVLYWLNESWSGFHGIGHNSARDLVALWIIPNGAWIIFPTYLIYAYGREILDSMAPSTHRATEKLE